MQSNNALNFLTLNLLLNIIDSTVYHKMNLKRFVSSLIICSAKIGSDPLFCNTTMLYYSFQKRVENYLSVLAKGH